MNAITRGSLAVLLALCNTAQANPIVYAATQASAVSPAGDVEMLDFGIPTGNIVGAGSSAATVGASAGATAEAGMGYARAFAHGGNAGGLGGSFAHARAGFQDSITLVNDALTGQMGEVTLGFYYNYASAYTGQTSAEAFSNGFVGFGARAGAGFAGMGDYRLVGVENTSHYYREDARGVTDVFDGYTGVLYITTEFQWGEAFDIGLDVAALGATGSGDATEFGFRNDARNGGYWDGVRSISTDGSLVDTFRIVSESGIDYSRSFAPVGRIPEPGSWLLLLAGVAMMVSVRQLKRRA